MTGGSPLDKASNSRVRSVCRRDVVMVTSAPSTPRLRAEVTKWMLHNHLGEVTQPSPQPRFPVSFARPQPHHYLQTPPQRGAKGRTTHSAFRRQGWQHLDRDFVRDCRDLQLGLVAAQHGGTWGRMGQL